MAISGKKPRAIFTDVGGVLLTNGWDRKSRALAIERFGLDAAETEERHHLTFDTYESGKLSLDEYLDRLVFFKPRPYGKEEFRHFMFEQSQPFDDMLALIPALKEKHGLRLAVVNNEGRELNNHRIRKFHLTTFVDFFISSCFVHFRKPDADIFRIALDIAGVLPEDVVYIDDRPMFVEVATGLGIRGLVHENTEKTKAALAEIGLG